MRNTPRDFKSGNRSKTGSACLFPVHHRQALVVNKVILWGRERKREEKRGPYMREMLRDSGQGLGRSGTGINIQTQTQASGW